MADIGSWHNHIFTVSADVLRSFKDMTIKGSLETDEKTTSNEKYVVFKGSGIRTLSITVELNGLLGCNVRQEAMLFLEEASSGAEDFFYVGNEKLLSCKLLLTEATVEKVQMNSRGDWTSADVKLEFKQSTRNDGTTKASWKYNGPEGSLMQNKLDKQKKAAEQAAAAAAAAAAAEEAAKKSGGSGRKISQKALLDKRKAQEARAKAENGINNARALSLAKIVSNAVAVKKLTK